MLLTPESPNAKSPYQYLLQLWKQVTTTAKQQCAVNGVPIDDHPGGAQLKCKQQRLSLVV